MPLDRFVEALNAEVGDLEASGMAKGAEQVITDVLPANEHRGPRFFLKGCGDREFLRMNSNSYLGLSVRKEIIAAEEHAAHKFGVGPGAVRFISGTYEPHVELERKLAAFHSREDCMLTSAAYTSVLGVISTLTTPETIIISDELNHNCIINAMRLARPKERQIYKHLDSHDLEARIEAAIGHCEGLLVVTDGVFSMRGDYAPLDRICALAKKHSDRFARGIVTIVDDSHGVGALGVTGHGTEEQTGAAGADILVATLGKALGVNGGYIVSSRDVIKYLRQKNALYIYTNPITPPEAASALKALEILQSDLGRRLLSHLHAMTVRFENGLKELGYETLESPHPVTPLMVRDTEKTTRLVQFLHDHNVLATGLNYPVVPKGDQSIRFQVCADHTAFDIDYVLDVLNQFKSAL
jgi:glycine C-acetyltransferase